MEFKNVTSVFTEHYLAIPDYQRDYSWTPAENGDLFEDIRQLFESDESETHFLGAIVTTAYDPDSASDSVVNLEEYDIKADDVRHLVDGQQRLTSLSLFMVALTDQLQKDLGEGTRLSDSDYQRLKGLVNSVEACLRGNELSAVTDYQAPRLFLNGNTGKIYLTQYLHASSINGEGRLAGARRLKRAYQLFSDGLSDLEREWLEENAGLTAYDFYKRMLNVLTKKLKLVVIECESAMSAFQVFDSLNGKGLDLTAADRIKNIFLSWCPNKREALGHWESMTSGIDAENLVQYFSTLLYYEEGKRVSKPKLPDHYKTLYHNRAKEDYSFFFNQQKEAADCYSRLKKRNTGILELDNDIIPDIQALGQEQVFFPLFAACYRTRFEKNKKEIVDFARQLLNFAVRMQVCEKSTNKFDAIFSDCIKLIKQDESLKVVTRRLADRTREVVGDSAFHEAFKQLHTKKTGVAEVYLRAIENKLRKEKGFRESVSRTANSHKIGVEHIIPQDTEALREWYGEDYGQISDCDLGLFSEDVIQSIGNMMLLYDDDNASAGNLPYDKKCIVYRNGSGNDEIGTPESTFRMVEDLLERYPGKFNREQVEERAEWLADLATRIW